MLLYPSAALIIFYQSLLFGAIQRTMRFIFLRLRTAYLLRAIRSSPPKLARLCGSLPRTPLSQVSTLFCLGDVFIAVPTLFWVLCVGCHICTNRNALLHLILCKYSTKKGEDLTIGNTFYSGQGHGGKS